MNIDILDRLVWLGVNTMDNHVDDTCRAAADEIKRLREELDAEGNWGNLLAVEIKRLQAENERLRAGGDALEHSLLMWQSKHPHLDLGYDALAAWQEARRG